MERVLECVFEVSKEKKNKPAGIKVALQPFINIAEQLLVLDMYKIQ